jgi:hypothetical protein
MGKFCLQFKKDKILIYLMYKLFLCQYCFPFTSDKAMSKKVYTFFYITKILSNFGLIAPINRRFGF